MPPRKKDTEAEEHDAALEKAMDAAADAEDGSDMVCGAFLSFFVTVGRW
jgi:hypothetical protein